MRPVVDADGTQKQFWTDATSAH